MKSPSNHRGSQIALPSRLICSKQSSCHKTAASARFHLPPSIYRCTSPLGRGLDSPWSPGFNPPLQRAAPLRRCAASRRVHFQAAPRSYAKLSWLPSPSIGLPLPRPPPSRRPPWVAPVEPPPLFHCSPPSPRTALNSRVRGALNPPPSSTRQSPVEPLGRLCRPPSPLVSKSPKSP